MVRYILKILQEMLQEFFFKLGFTSCKAEQPLQGMELQEKEAQKDYIQHIGNPFRKNLQLSVNSRLKATKIIGQSKAF